MLVLLYLVVPKHKPGRGLYYYYYFYYYHSTHSQSLCPTAYVTLSSRVENIYTPEPECGIKRAFEDVNPYEHYNTDMNTVGSEHYMMMYQNSSMYQNSMMMNLNPSNRTNGIHIPDTLAQHSVRTNLRVVYNPVLSVDQVSRLFDIIPGFLGLQLQEVGSNGALGLVSYSSTEYAEHALTKLQVGLYN